VDTMFGSTERITGTLFNYINTLSIDSPTKCLGKILNRASEPVRLENYVPNPIGNYLTWQLSTIKPTISSSFGFAFSSDGTRLGVYDFKQATVISPSGIFLVLLDYYARVLKKRGTILLTNSMSERVEILAKKLQFRIERIPSTVTAFNSALEKKRRSGVLLFGNEYGGFWFKGDIRCNNCLVTMCKVIEACSHSNKSPGELLDTIMQTYKIPNLAYSTLLLPRGLINKETIEAKLSDKGAMLDKNEETIVDFENTRIVIKDNIKQSCIEIFIESENKEATKDVSGLLQQLYTR